MWREVEIVKLLITQYKNEPGTGRKTYDLRGIIPMPRSCLFSLLCKFVHENLYAFVFFSVGATKPVRLLINWTVGGEKWKL
jgi:hypothetical protein